MLSLQLFTNNLLITTTTLNEHFIKISGPTRGYNHADPSFMCVHKIIIIRMWYVNKKGLGTGLVVCWFLLASEQHTNFVLVFN